MKSRIFLLVCLHVIVVANSQTKGGVKNPRVNAPIGPIEGSYIKSRLGKQIASFRGIPYAEAPVGNNRFRQAIPVKSWRDTLDATKDGPMCVNPEVPVYSEDCLRLNVYTTKLPTASENPKRPVIVFFHPGAFFVSTAISTAFGPHYLADKDVVLVTVNYRLGTLGFISTGDAVAPGNLGLKDQVEALRWMKRNIVAFGGDPDSVTITGYSAGAWSVDLHMMSPMSKGLFHRIIAMSGSPVPYQLLPTQQTDIAVKQARLLGCPTKTSQEIVDCLKTKPPQNFTDTFPEFLEWNGHPGLIWSPVVEPEVPGVERFLTAQPADLIRQRKFQQVPIITGVVRDEFAGSVIDPIKAAQAGNDSYFRDLNDNWETLAPIVIRYERGTQRSKEISKELRQLYFPNGVINLDSVEGLKNIFVDGVTFVTRRFARLTAEASELPVYFYRFSYPGRYSWCMWNSTTPFGICHHTDLFYLFHMSFMVPFFEVGSPETQTIDRMTAIFESFAKTGHPIPPNDPNFKDVEWERFSPEKDNFLEISNDLVMKRGLYPERMNALERIFPVPRISSPSKTVKG